MPAIVPFIPLIAAGVGALTATGVAIDQNVQNKAALKNNENQQKSAVANAQNATKTAQGTLANWTANNPQPGAPAGAGTNPITPVPTVSGAQPSSVARAPVPVNTSSIMAGAAPNPVQTPQQLQIAQLLKQFGTGANNA